jgi:hypothetical protein
MRSVWLREGGDSARLPSLVIAGIAQLVEHNLAKVGVAGSSPVSRSPEENVAGWSSLVARRAHNPEVVGSNPTPAMAVQRTENRGLRTERSQVAASVLETSVLSS